jgi:hypothetical protein
MDPIEPKDGLEEVLDFLKDGIDPDIAAHFLSIRSGISISNAREEVKTAAAIIQNLQR